jgi:hypothetical protein
MLVAIITLITIIATALPSAADLYTYRDESGQLVLSNQPPPAGAEVESQRESSASSSAPDAPAEPTAPRPAPQRLPSYVDRNPLELQGTGVEDSTVYWKKFVTGAVKNRSGFTTASNVTVRMACTLGGRPADTGSAYLGTIGPRGSAGFQIPIILNVQRYWKNGHLYMPEIGPVRSRRAGTADLLTSPTCQSRSNAVHFSEPLAPNARGEPPPEAGARHERRLQGVGLHAFVSLQGITAGQSALGQNAECTRRP